MQNAAPILTLKDLVHLKGRLKDAGKSLVLTNGCFDLLHPGHVLYLEHARSLGDFLVVAVNSDASVSALKGPTRPLNSAQDRCIVLSRLRSVDALTVFEDLRVTNLVNSLHPDVYVKGGDYTLDTLEPTEKAALEACSARIEIVPVIDGKSTSRLIQKISCS